MVLFMGSSVLQVVVWGLQGFASPLTVSISIDCAYQGFAGFLRDLSGF